MDNNDRLIRIRYALDIKDTDMVVIFRFGGLDLSQEEISKLLTKTDHEEKESILCDTYMLETFLNGLIIFKRGKQELKPGQKEAPKYVINDSASVNNVLFKKLKIALSLTGDEILQILNQGGVTVTKGELGAICRKEGHKNYKVCGDKYTRKFLKGLSMKYRKK